MFISSRYYYSKIYDLHSYHIVAQETFNRRHFAFFLVFLRTPFELLVAIAHTHTPSF